jgi:hypothetical protein
MHAILNSNLQKKESTRLTEAHRLIRNNSANKESQKAVTVMYQDIRQLSHVRNTTQIEHKLTQTSPKVSATSPQSNEIALSNELASRYCKLLNLRILFTPRDILSIDNRAPSLLRTTKGVYAREGLVPT